MIARNAHHSLDLNPVWDQIIYIPGAFVCYVNALLAKSSLPVHSLKETMLLECMDYQHLTKVRPLISFCVRH